MLQERQDIGGAIAGDTSPAATHVAYMRKANGEDVTVLVSDLFAVYQQSHVADPAAMASITASNPSAMASITLDPVTAVANVDGATPNLEFQDSSAQVSQAEYRVFAKTLKDLLGQISVDLAAVKTAVDANNAEIDALVVDITAAKAGIDANNASIDSILATLEAAQLHATS